MAKFELLTDDMDIRDTRLSMDVGGNGDYYLNLTETKRGKVVNISTRIATSGGNASPDVLRAISSLYKALRGEKSDEPQTDTCNMHGVNGSVCTCEMPAKVKGKNECWRCKKPLKDFLQTDR